MIKQQFNFYINIAKSKFLGYKKIKKKKLIFFVFLCFKYNSIIYKIKTIYYNKNKKINKFSRMKNIIMI